MLQKLDMVIPVDVLGLSGVEIVDIYLRDKHELIIKVKSTQDETTCRKCGKICQSHGHDRPMELRHLPILGYKTFIQLSPKRGICRLCDDSPSTTQTLGWYERNARQTKPYQRYLMFSLINSTVADVSRKEDIHAHTIESIIDKEIATEVDFSKIKAIGVLGIDEISLRKGRQKYVTVITSRHQGETRVLKVLDGRKKETIEKFFRSIPKHLRKTVSAVCSDLYDGFINAAKAVFGAQIVTADRFHVAKLYRKSLVKLRKSELKRLKQKLSDVEYKELKDAIAILRKGRDYFTEEETSILQLLFNHSPKLRLAYLYSHRLTTTFNANLTKTEALGVFMRWIDEVNNSELKCFNTFIVTLQKYMNEITNYFLERNNSGFVEGFNNRLKVLTRRCYGLKNISRFFQRIKIDTEGLYMFRFAGA